MVLQQQHSQDIAIEGGGYRGLGDGSPVTVSSESLGHRPESEQRFNVPLDTL